MNDTQQAYLQWAEWTDAETDAIDRSDWERLRECQRQKALLQSRISRLEGLSGQPPGGDPSLRPVVEKLLQQERLNQERLHRKRLLAEQQQMEARQSGRTLRRIHGAYVPAHGVRWQTYS